ncbi:hypothetical protein RHMOL_Rhmol02G0227600 [Rhododendron molle]|uniref:Uncharacterized protein n=1 Tax=Rhododendron molle TaxID=49168 RepID=A0ACC0PUG0_RHOML|nr:hypothetical protein RHMOL_Rhmol02G0227600 [Rhododendron molle]
MINWQEEEEEEAAAGKSYLLKEAAKRLETTGELIWYSSIRRNRIGLLADNDFFGRKYSRIFPVVSANGQEGAEYKPLPGGPSNDTQKETKDIEASILKQLFDLQISLKHNNYTITYSMAYWVLNLLQIPVSVGVTLNEAINLYKGRRVIASKRDDGTNWKVQQLLLNCSCGVLAVIVGGLLGLGGGFIMGPLFLELGVPPQKFDYHCMHVAALYFMAVATVAAFVGQHVVTKLLIVLGRASLIIFILAFMIFVSAISLGGVGISNMIGKTERHEYMGFKNLCKDA